MKFFSGSVKAAVTVLGALAYSFYAHSIEYVSQSLPPGLHLNPTYLLVQHMIAWNLANVVSTLYFYFKEKVPLREQVRLVWEDYCGSDATEANMFVDNKVDQKGIRDRLWLKMLCLSALLLVALYSFLAGASTSPAYDNALMQNSSIFEIVTLFMTVCGLASSSARALFRNFVSSSIALIGIMVLSYYTSSADMLSGKYHINPLTGESSDVFLFDRLKSSLICGLGNLALGPFIILWEVWFMSKIRAKTEPAKSLSMHFLLLLLTIFVSGLAAAMALISKAKGVRTDGLMPPVVNPWLLLSMFIIHLPTVAGLSYLWITESTGALMSLPLLNIIIMGIMRWLVEIHTRIVTTGEIFGYCILVVGLIVTYNSYSK